MGGVYHFDLGQAVFRRVVERGIKLAYRSIYQYPSPIPKSPIPESFQGQKKRLAKSGDLC